MTDGARHFRKSVGKVVLGSDIQISIQLKHTEGGTIAKATIDVG